MARSYHVTKRQINRDAYLNCDDDGRRQPGISELEVQSLKKVATKYNEKWKRDTEKAGGIRRTAFRIDDNGSVTTAKVKCRGILSDPHTDSHPVQSTRNGKKTTRPNRTGKKKSNGR